MPEAEGGYEMDELVRSLFEFYNRANLFFLGPDVGLRDLPRLGFAEDQGHDEQHDRAEDAQEPGC